MKKLLCLILSLFALCTAFNEPSSYQQLDNESKKKNNWCGGYIDVDNTSSSSEPRILSLRMMSGPDPYELYSIPSGQFYSVPVILNTGYSYDLKFNVALPVSSINNDWVLEMKRPDGTVVRKTNFSKVGSNIYIDVQTGAFSPDCLTYEISIRMKGIFD